ncbi:MAG: SpoIIE family protein phosphatase [Syntrophobacterales bacterium]|jgi:sigma-B regulation protein RsbU (phosphoserine phosphatase)
MSVRWKVTIFFMMVSLAPLLVVTLVGQRGIVRMGETITGFAKENRTEIVSKELQQTAMDYAKILGREKEVIELTLRIIARDAERFLSEPPESATKVYFSDDYDNPAKAPEDIEFSHKHIKGTAGTGTEPMVVSFGHQVFLVRPGADWRYVASDIGRLRRLLPVHSEFENQLRDILYWQYVSLESGVSAAYPGHGGYPSTFNPQTRPWYVLAREKGELAWSTPYMDFSTRQVIMTASMPIYHSDGAFAGVAAIDVLLSEVLQINELSSQWSTAMRSFLVWSGVKEETDEYGLWIIAQKDYVEHAAAWSGAMGVERLASSDVESMELLEGEIRARQAGYIDMPYFGMDSVWAYGHAGDDLNLILIVPKRIILEQFERIRESLHSLVKEQWLITGVVGIGVILLLMLAGLWFAHGMIRPLYVMVEAVKRLAKGDFSARMNINTGDERDLLAQTFNDMVPQLEDRIQIRKSLEVAKEVQQNLLPQEIPNLRGFDIAAKSVYCDETGGDYFDFFPCENEDCARFGIVVGDVTGHGVGAALLMATARALIRGLVTRPENLAVSLTQVNSLLSADVRDSGRFISLFFLMIEEGSRAISWVRAGHDPAFLYDPATDTVAELKGPGLVLGVEEDYSYEHVEKTIETDGTIIFIGTDGIWETHNGEGEMFGKDRLSHIIRKNNHKSAGAIQDAVLEAVSDFRGDGEQEDDITIVVIKVLP